MAVLSGLSESKTCRVARLGVERLNIATHQRHSYGLRLIIFIDNEQKVERAITSLTTVR